MRSLARPLLEEEVSGGSAIKFKKGLTKRKKTQSLSERATRCVPQNLLPSFMFGRGEFAREILPDMVFSDKRYRRKKLIKKKNSAGGPD